MSNGENNKFDQGLYDPRNEHDSCGIGFIADIKNRKSHKIVRDGLTILENLTHRGATGGYTLDRPADEVSMAQIIQAMEGPIALTACVEGSGNHCEVECLCPMRGNWEQVNRAIHKALSEVTLADMAASCWNMFGVLEEPSVTVERRDI